MHALHPLDRPIWSALTTRQANLALGDGRAVRLAPDYGLFAAAADASPQSLASLAALVPAGGQVALVEAEEPPSVPGATLTRPGPFFVRTHQLGDFVGVKLDGQLVAMAGERMKPTGFTEVSGVCTHPEHRGRGYAGALMGVVAGRILSRGETAFLHTYADNTGAIALYESLGFAFRRELGMTVLSRA